MLQWALECMYFFKKVFLFTLDIPRSKTTGSHGRCILFFFRNLHTVFHSGWANSHFQWCRRVHSSPHPHQNLFFVFFLMIAILTGVRWYIIVVLICISLILAMRRIFSCVGHLYVFGRKSSQAFQFLNWVVSFFDIEWYKLFIYFVY